MTPLAVAAQGAADAVADIAAIDGAAHALGAALRARGWTMAAAESCTGGGVAFAVTQVVGASHWFDRGFVTYSNEAKQQMLCVPAELIAAHGAVSEPVAQAMARGALANSSARAALAVTGIAGPGGAVPGKPVGTVCFAWAVRGDNDMRLTSATHRLDGDRAAVRTQSIVCALDGLRRAIEAAPPT
jgi:nicotinamide-nucleotide amidase